MNAWTEKVDRAGIVELASALIAIPSESGHERAVMQFVAEWCDRLSLPYRIAAKDPDRPNIIVSIGDASAGPTIAMNGHLDVVPAPTRPPGAATRSRPP